jgi:hypothetical protein
MALDGVEDGVGVEALEQEERSTELNIGQEAEEPAAMR